MSRLDSRLSPIAAALWWRAHARDGIEAPLPKADSSLGTLSDPPRPHAKRKRVEGYYLQAHDAREDGEG